MHSLLVLSASSFWLLSHAAAARASAPPVFGSNATTTAFKAWLSTWRNFYCHSNASALPELQDSDLPSAFKGIPPRSVPSDGGAASGIVTEGMGYALMLEGMMAAQGDGWALNLALGLMRSWLAMVQGSSGTSKPPLGGSDKRDGSATKVNTRPYGVSAIPGKGPAGVATWKFPREECFGLGNRSDLCHGSATDGDEDALLGMIYLAAALDYPSDFVDLVIRTVIAFASADLGFPDLYRTLPDGKRVYVPKAGSQWGGLTPPYGKYKRERGVPDWCYAPSYFAPAHYRTFRNFVKNNWVAQFDEYLPPHLDGTPTHIQDLTAAFDAANLAGYNILYYSSCESGTVSNWVGVEAACEDKAALSCTGVPWAHTPYVGKKKRHCSASGTGWGSFGSDASRMPWRIAMDYALFTKESEGVQMYGRDGQVDRRIKFNARHYLNRIVTQYRRYGKCDGGKMGECDCHYTGCKPNWTQAINLSSAFEILQSDKPPTPTNRTPGLICHNVPKYGQSWWAGFMSYPTFTAFIAPYHGSMHTKGESTLKAMSREENKLWLDTLANICDFSKFNDAGGWQILGSVCQKTYFHVSQEVISTMIMSGSLPRVPEKRQRPKGAVVMKVEDTGDIEQPTAHQGAKAALGLVALAASAAVVHLGMRCRSSACSTNRALILSDGNPALWSYAEVVM